MNGNAEVPGEDKIVVSVSLTCLSCGKAEEIHVFRKRRLSPKVYWECFDCQRNGNRSGERPKS